MSTLTANISLFHDTSNIFTNWGTDNEVNDLAGYDGSKTSEENINASLSSILPLALHNISMDGEDKEDHGQSVGKGPLVSKRVRDIFVTINMAILAQIISLFGVVANIVNIIVFTKQGFGEAMTVTLTGLAVADLGTVTCQVWLSICWNPWFHLERLKLPFRPLDIEYLSAGHPRLSSVRISAWILALATFERCLCVTIPFKVR